MVSQMFRGLGVPPRLKLGYSEKWHREASIQSGLTVDRMIQQWNARPIFCASALSFFRRSIFFSKCIQNNESPLVIDRKSTPFQCPLDSKTSHCHGWFSEGTAISQGKKIQIDLRAYSSGYSSDIMSQYTIIVRLTKKTKTLRVHIRIYPRIWSTICQNIFQNRIYFWVYLR